MYSLLPRTVPVLVFTVRFVVRAMPKSTSFTWPS